MLLYWLIVLALQTPYFKSESSSLSQIALLSSLIFVVHPVQTQAVTYITQRFASLAALFYLGSMAFYVKWRLKTERQRAVGRQGDKSPSPSGGIYLYILSLLSAVLAMKTKENSVTLPAALALFEVLFFRGPLLRRLLGLLPVALTTLLIVVPALEPGGLYEGTRALKPMPRLDFLFTELRVIVTYIRLLIFPVNQNLDYDYPVYGSILRPEVFLSLCLLTSLFVLGGCLLKRGGALRLSAFGIFFFFVTLSVEAGIVPTEVIYEHRLYLPSAGAFMAFAAGSSVALRRHGSAKKAFAVIIVSLLGLVAYERNKVWASEISLWSDVVKKSPGKAKPHLNLGFAYLNKGMTESAASELEIALGINPNSALAHNNLGAAYSDMGRSAESIEHFLSALRLDPDYTEAHNNLGIAYRNAGRTEDAVKHFKKALNLKPYSHEVQSNLGLAYADMGLTDKAIEHYEEALRLKSDSAEAHVNIGNAYDAKGLSDRAIEHYETALRLKPDNPDAYNNLATIYQAKGMLDKATEYYEIAIRLRPDYAEAHFNIASVYKSRGMMDEAREHLRIAFRLRPDLAKGAKK